MGLRLRINGGSEREFGNAALGFNEGMRAAIKGLTGATWLVEGQALRAHASHVRGGFHRRGEKAKGEREEKNSASSGKRKKTYREAVR